MEARKIAVSQQWYLNCEAIPVLIVNEMNITALARRQLSDVL